MTTLRVRLAALPSPDRADAWALVDATGTCVRSGVDPPRAWPTAETIEVVLAASQLRIATVGLPPMPSARVPAAARFALEDQLAGPAAAHQLATSVQAPDGTVRVVVAARALVAAIARMRGPVARIIAEPELALPLAGWRWCAGDEGGEGFVRCSDGSAFPVDAPGSGGALPAELRVALAQARRGGTAPADVRVDAAFADTYFARWQQETGVAFLRGTPWRWQSAPPAAFAEAIDLLPDAEARESAPRRPAAARLFAPALWLAAAAFAIHVVGTVGEWAALRIDAWRDAREWSALATAAGAPPDAALTPQSARAALAQRYANLRHAKGLPAPDDALPLLARAAPALAALPAGIVRTAVYADGHWTLDLVRADPPALRDLDARMRAAGVPVLAATSASGTRVRFGGP